MCFLNFGVEAMSLVADLTGVTMFVAADKFAFQCSEIILADWMEFEGLMLGIKSMPDALLLSLLLLLLRLGFCWMRVNCGV